MPFQSYPEIRAGGEVASLRQSFKEPALGEMVERGLPSQGLESGPRQLVVFLLQPEDCKLHELGPRCVPNALDVFTVCSGRRGDLNDISLQIVVVGDREA